MVIYQDDYTKVSLQSPVSLLISSVPRDILLEPEEFYLWMDRVMVPHGVVFIDMPSESEYVNAFYGVLKHWKLQWDTELSDFYREGNCQRLTCLSKYPVSKPSQIPYRVFSEREMQHQCEFDSILIAFLIGTFFGGEERCARSVLRNWHGAAHGSRFKQNRRRY